MGLGAIIAILRVMNDAERTALLDYVWARYGHRADEGPRPYVEAETNELTRHIMTSEHAFDSELFARALLDAGWRRVSTR